MYKRIRDLREDRDMTQKQVAQMLGMSQTGYSKYETGENDIPTQILIRLADFYKTSTDYLLGRSEKRVIEVSNLTDEQIFHIASIVNDLGMLNDSQLFSRNI